MLVSGSTLTGGATVTRGGTVSAGGGGSGGRGGTGVSVLVPAPGNGDGPGVPGAVAGGLLPPQAASADSRTVSAISRKARARDMGCRPYFERDQAGYVLLPVSVTCR